MTLKEWIQNKILNFLGIEKTTNPNSNRLTYISDDEEIQIEKIRSHQVWYIGDGDELLNYYTNQEVFGFAKNPIYNRNKRNYFWGLSSGECNIKRVHSGVPNAIIFTIVNMVGMPQITVGQRQPLTEKADEQAKQKQATLNAILEANDFTYKLTQQARPKTLVEGWGAWKIDIDKDLSPYPILSFYGAEDVEYVVKMDTIIAVIFKTYYKSKDNKKNYVMLETRKKQNGNSVIEYNLFQLNKDNSIEEVSPKNIPELSHLPTENLVIPNLNDILAVPSKYFYDPLRPKYGRSVFDGKEDLFDDLDQCLSQASQTDRVSTPVEYYDVDVLERTADGVPILPSKYNRQYIAKHGGVDGNGETKEESIITTQPVLNFEQYNQRSMMLLNKIFVGLLSPATMGIDVARNDNALAQREKEKVSILTRLNIIDRETIQHKKLIDLTLKVYEYMETGNITLKPIPISIKYNEFANPSFETMIKELGEAYSNKRISTDKYVDLLWGDRLSEDDKQAQIKWLDEHQVDDNIDLGSIYDTTTQPIRGQDITEEENINQVQDNLLNKDI